MSDRYESAIEPSLKEKVVGFAIVAFGVYGVLSVSDSVRPPYMEPWARAGVAVAFVFMVAVAWRWKTR